MKSFIKLFTDLYSALLQDIVLVFPTIRVECERDLSRLISALNNEGLSFITITHLEMCTFFQKALASEAFPDSSVVRPPRGYGYKSSRDRRPLYLHGLTSLVFSEDGMLRSDPDPTAIFFLRQWLLMAKKTVLDCSNDRTESALEEFLAVDAENPDHYPDTWDSDEPKWSARYGHPLWGSRTPDRDQHSFFSSVDHGDEGLDWELFRSLCGLLRSQIGTVDPFSLRPKHGPGAVADPVGLKYEFRHWPAKLQSIFPWDFFAAADFGLYKLEHGRQPNIREVPSTVIAVPKTQKGPRIICKEPIAHQWIQGGVERFLRERIKHTFLVKSVDIADQNPSRELALLGSVDGSLATVDLSAASDRLSTRLVEYVFQGGDNSLLDVLHACRSRYFSLGDAKGKFRKFAPMGSACTFPVQSLVFAVISTFAIMQSRGLGLSSAAECASMVRVFGDDIIVPVDAYGKLVQALSSLGLRVNVGKSYATGLFRESCGMDAYAGVDVTPAYVRRLYKSSSHSTLESVVECSNNFFQKGLWHTSAELLKTIPEKERKLLPVGYSVNGAVSLASFCGTDVSHLESRFDTKLHRLSYRALTVSSRLTKDVSDGDAGLIQFFVEEPDPSKAYASGQVRRPRTIKSARWV